MSETTETKRKVKLPVLEIFGPTIQGEGMVIGRKTMFVRVAGCDYRCSWCDSAFAWDGSAKNEIEQLPVETILERLYAVGDDRFDHVTISGGNPALLSGAGELVDRLHEDSLGVAVETQGSCWQDWLSRVDDLTISPKPPSSKMKTSLSMLDEILTKLSGFGRIPEHVSLKVVIFDAHDFQYAEEMHQRYPEVPFYLQVGNPDVTALENGALHSVLLDRLAWLIDRTITSNVMNDARVLPQLHTLVWGNRRGV